MASRESFGMQVALIVSVVLILVLGVTTFTYYSQAESARQEADSMKQTVQTANQDRNLWQGKYYALKYMIEGGVVINALDAGGDPIKDIQEKLSSELLNTLTSEDASRAMADEDVKAIATNYYRHMAAFGLDSDLQRNYSNLPDFMLQVVNKKNDANAALQNNNSVLVAEKEQVEKTEAANTKQFSDAADQARAELTKEKSNFDTERDRILKENDGYASQMQQNQQQLVSVQSQAREEKDKYTKQVRDLEKIVTGQKVLLSQYDEESFEAPDGRVTVVNHKLRVCYIDVGEEDGLQRQQTFAVYDAGQTAVMKAAPKGRLEVIQILGDHLAMCRILHDETTNLIGTGDIIHTPAWGPGRRVRFAVAGLIDINGDGTSDRAQLEEIIRINGGILDADVTPSTRYLIKGEPKSETPGATDMSPQERATFNNAIDIATQIGVDQISVDKMLAYMGWRGDINIVMLGTGDSNIEFNPSERTGRTSTGNTSGAFRRRTPSSGDGGAF